MAWRIGIDSGGTFTDICLFDERSGRVEVWKVPSTPDDPSRGIAGGAAESLARLSARPAEVAYLGHGTTVATNALIQHRGALTAFVTSAGFRDLLEIGRQKRPDLYDLAAEKPPILVPRDLRIEARERIRHDGTVEFPLDEAALRRSARRLKGKGIAALAIGFLYGFVRPHHEAIAKRILAEELPDVFLSVAHEVAPEFREFERFSTAVVNAYLGPVMSRYITRLSARFSELGLSVAPRLTQSNGGVISFDTAARLPVRTVLSGPSTGVVAAQAIGRMVGIADLVTFDMGGTSTDVALLAKGEAAMTGEATVHGYPIKAPMLDIHTVGAGGGSIAFVDSGGHLKVGPRSAGADPGPVCYDRGNAEPTVTDANVVLGTLHPTHLLGGRMPIRRELAEKAISGLAKSLRLDPMATAQGIVSVVTANMAKAIRVISVQRGHDPRDYTLVAFGGAGPLHAARLARELEMKRILVPRNPGIVCAMGLLLTDLRSNFAVTKLTPLTRGAESMLKEAFARLEIQAKEWFIEEGIARSDRGVVRSVDMRYAGQNYELSVSLPAGAITSATLGKLAAGFAEAHRRRYGFSADEEAMQLVTYRVEAIGTVRKARFEARQPAGPNAGAARMGERRAWLPETGGFVTCPVYDREKLRPGNRIAGPALIDQMDATTLVLPHMVARVEPYLNLILESE